MPKDLENDLKIWGTIVKQIPDFSNSGLILRCQSTWDTLREPHFDKFRTRLDKSAEYAAFFLRAILGEHPHRLRDKDWSGWLNWGNETLIVKDEIALSCLRAANERDVIGADLVARMALTVAWHICQSSGCNLYPALDNDINHPLRRDVDGNCKCQLRFLSADFVEGSIVGGPRSAIVNGAKRTYYKYEWDQDKNDSVRNHGWRMKSERYFTNDPYAVDGPRKDGSIESFLGFPAFFQHEATKIVFHCPLEEEKFVTLFSSIEEASNVDPSVSDLLDLGLRPYVVAKQDEFTCRENAQGSVTLCLGIAAQEAAFFDPAKLRTAYGVFFTVDFVQVDQPPCPCRIDLSKVCHALENSRHQLQYKVLQVLTATLLRESERKNQELEKFRSMYNQLLRPLRSLTDAVRKTQEDAHEILAVIYDPLDVVLGCQPEIAELFNEGESIEILDDSKVTIKHVPQDYTEDVAYKIAAELFNRLVPAAIRAQRPGLPPCELLANVIAWLLAESRNISSPYRDIVRALMYFIDRGDWKSIGVEFGRNGRKVVNELLGSIKDRLFTLYKPDEASRALKWDVVRSYLATIKCDDEFLDPVRCDAQVLPDNSNPFSTHGHVVDFIGRVVAQHCSHHTRRKTRPPSLSFELSNGLVVTSEFTWIPDITNFVEFLTQQIAFRTERVRPVREVGDLKRPFVDLIERIPYGIKPVPSKIGSNGLAICIDGLIFQFVETRFITSTNNVGRGP